MTTATPVAALDLVPLLLRSVSNQKICTLVSLDGRIDLEILGKALRHLLLHNPVLASELVLSRGEPLWRYRAERVKQATPQLSMTPEPDHSLARYPERLLAGKGDTLEIRVFRGPQHDALCITIDHTAADAAGCKEILRQISLVYTRLQSGEQILVDNMPTGSRDLGCVRARLGTLRTLSSLLRPGIVLPQWHFGHAPGRQPVTQVHLLRQFDAAGKGGLRAISQRYNATINDLLLAALFRALLATGLGGAKRQLPVQFTVDLRHYLPAGQRTRIANLSGADSVWLDTGHAGRFRTLVNQTHSAMRRVKARAPGTGSSLWTNWLLAHSFQRGRQLLLKSFNASRLNGRANPMLTNAGTLDNWALPFGTTAIRHLYMVTPNLLAPGLIVGAISFRNTLTLSAGVDANIADPEWVGNVLDRMISDLGTDP
jgi:NRPS condensation-like uncharacterized protein